MNNNIWQVYVHIIPKDISGYDNDKYYIGITSQTFERRCGNDGNKYKRQTYFWNAIQKYRWNNIKHILLIENLTHDEVCIIEIELIKKYHTTDENFGYNLTHGGEGSLGYLHSEEVKAKMRGRTSWCKGKKLSLETCRKISENHWDSSGLNSPKRRSVICLNNLKVFDLITDATIYAGFKKYDKSVSAVCRGQNTTAGFREDAGGRLYWMYYDKYIKLSSIEQEILHNNAINQINTNLKAVIRLNDNKIYQFINEASRDTFFFRRSCYKKML